MEAQQSPMATKVYKAPLSGVQRVFPVPFKSGIDATGNKGQYEFGKITAEWSRTYSHCDAGPCPAKNSAKQLEGKKVIRLNGRHICLSIKTQPVAVLLFILLFFFP